MATSAAAAGKIGVAVARGEPVPPGWVIDSEGKPTTDPRQLRQGGALLPLGGPDGGYKGTGLAVMVEILCGLLTGLGFGVEPTGRHNDGCFMAVFKVDAFRPLAEFKKEVGEFARYLKETPPSEGSQGVLYPGEIEHRREQDRRANGIDGVLKSAPYIKSTSSSGLSYLVRDENTFTAAETAGISNIYTNNLLATVDGPTGRALRWGADYNYNYTQFQGQPQVFRLELARLRLSHIVDPELSVKADVGYEKNDYTLSEFSGPIYGAGFDWKPTPRTDLYANLEHRFQWTAPVMLSPHDPETQADVLNVQSALQLRPLPVPQ
jgi:hypothetical protein